MKKTLNDLAFLPCTGQNRLPAKKICMKISNPQFSSLSLSPVFPLMGNYISCALTAPLGKHSRGMRVIFQTSEIRQLHQPLRTAELMLETPNFFLVNSKSLHLGWRFFALTTDEKLEPANVYLFFPMRRLNSVVKAPDVGLLFLAAQRVSDEMLGFCRSRIFHVVVWVLTENAISFSVFSFRFCGKTLFQIALSFE